MSRKTIRILSSSHEFRITVRVLRFALPELALWGTSGVAIVGRRTEGFLFLVVAHEAKLEEDGKEEEDAVLY